MPPRVRIVASLVAGLVALFLLVATALGGLHSDAPRERAVALLLAIMALGGAVALWFRKDRSGAIALLAALGVWMAWTLSRATGAALSDAPWWAALALAAGLGWRR